MHPDQNGLSAIERCPNEILLRIKEQLSLQLDHDENDIRQHMLRLRLTCHRFSSIFTRFVIHCLIFRLNIGEANELQIFGDAWDLAHVPAPEAFTPFISSLVIFYFLEWGDTKQEKVVKLLSPFLDELSRCSSLSSLDVTWNSTGLSYDRAAVLHNTLAERLLGTVHQASNGQLSSVTWTYPHSYRVHAMTPISHLFSSFRGIQSFSLTVISEPEVEAEAPPHSLLGNLLATHPSLRSLFLSCDLYKGILSNGSHVLDPPSPSSLPPRLPKISNLRKILVQTPGIVGEDHVEDKDPPSLDLLWLQLAQSGARPTDLHLDYGISRALMEYLSSYRGLVKAQFDVSALPISPTATHVSFAEAVLPLHAFSLRSLRIRAEAPFLSTGWEAMQFDPPRWPKPSAFISLAILAIVTPQAWELNAENIQTLLNYVMGMPKLQELTVRWTGAGVMEEEFDLYMSRIGEEVFVRRCGLEVLDVFTFVDGHGCGAEWRFAFPVDMEEERLKLGDFYLSREETEPSKLSSDDVDLFLDDSDDASSTALSTEY
ncbi:hypothetical protein AX16_007532 [Volvariella volvacea WC 439]|nr:hypothetical protein AX16_007532 [Volvariella volvacea WC 439]